MSDAESWNEELRRYEAEAVQRPHALRRSVLAADLGLLGRAMSVSGRPAVQLGSGLVSVLILLPPSLLPRSEGQPKSGSWLVRMLRGLLSPWLRPSHPSTIRNI